MHTRKPTTSRPWLQDPSTWAPTLEARARSIARACHPTMPLGKGPQYAVPCPGGHKTPGQTKLSIKVNDDGTAILIHCHDTCPRWKVLQALQCPPKYLSIEETLDTIPSYISLADLYKEMIPKHRWIIHHMLLKGGTGILFGKSDIGKTTLIRQLIACVATGTPFRDDLPR